MLLKNESIQTESTIVFWSVDLDIVAHCINLFAVVLTN